LQILKYIFEALYEIRIRKELPQYRSAYFFDAAGTKISEIEFTQ